MKFPRLAVRAVIVKGNRLLLVNAYPGNKSDLWCAPGGGVNGGSSLPDNLIREVHEETGLTITVGDLLGVNEFHDPKTGYHQVDVFFAAAVAQGQIDHGWYDIEGIVNQRRFFTRSELTTIRLKPDFLPALAFEQHETPRYGVFEQIVG